jgi:DNA-binding NarL/FixJ family response regulator
MYKLLFIDEEKETLEDFEDFVENFPAKIELQAITQLPLADKEEMIDCIIKLAPDALISDFRLNEMKTDIDYTVPYNGVDLVEEFQSIRNHFPCFVLTALDDEAVNQSDDVNIVYVKNILYKKDEGEGKAKAQFLDRVISQIEHYQKRIENSKNELMELVKVREAGEADIEIENRIIILDDFLEKSIDARNSIPSEFKTLSNSTRLDNILNKVDTLLNKLGDNAE